jgi:hypothetical protein
VTLQFLRGIHNLYRFWCWADSELPPRTVNMNTHKHVQCQQLGCACAAACAVPVRACCCCSPKGLGCMCLVHTLMDIERVAGACRRRPAANSPPAQATPTKHIRCTATPTAWDMLSGYMTADDTPIGVSRWNIVFHTLLGFPVEPDDGARRPTYYDRAGSLFKHARSQLRDKAAATARKSDNTCIETAMSMHLSCCGM